MSSVPLDRVGRLEGEPSQEASSEAPLSSREAGQWDFRQSCVDVTFGLVALAVGVAGLILPILPGWLAIVAGVVVLAGRIPPLRRALSRAMMTPRMQRVLERLATSEKTRRVMTKALLRTRIREAVDPPARMSVVNLLAKTNAEAKESEDAE